MNKQYILDEIKRTAAANGGRPLGMARFRKASGIKQTDWYGKFWVRWNEALGEAGYGPNTMTTGQDQNLILDKLVRLVRKLGRYPLKAEVMLEARRDPEFPSYRVLANRFGSKQRTAKALLAYCKGTTDYDDIVAICAPLSQAAGSPQAPQRNDPEGGVVYLLKAGRYYKIGYSNAAGRREYELDLQLPEKPRLIHTIRTDDPRGIEAYWHNRFAEKRKRREWFDLTAQDIQAFKRREFM